MVSAFVVRLAVMVAVLMLTSPTLSLGAVFHTLTVSESNPAPLNGWECSENAPVLIVTTQGWQRHFMRGLCIDSAAHSSGTKIHISK